MGVPSKINWGRSYPMQRTEAPPVELVRVQLPSSHDITVYLNEGTNIMGYVNLNDFVVTFGNGGTSREIRTLASVRGTVLHVVASQVVVRSKTFTPYAIPDAEMSAQRVSAMAAIGRPSEVRRLLFNNDNSNNIVHPAGSRDFTLDPWVQAVSISIQPTPLPSSAVDVSVLEISRMPSGDTGLLVPQSLANYNKLKVLHPFTNVLRIANNGAEAVYADIEQAFVL